MTPIPVPRISPENPAPTRPLTQLLRRWAQSPTATAAVISTVLVGLVAGVVGLGILAVHLLGTPGVGVSLLIAAATIGPGVMYVDKKLTP